MLPYFSLRSLRNFCYSTKGDIRDTIFRVIHNSRIIKMHYWELYSDYYELKSHILQFMSSLATQKFLSLQYLRSQFWYRFDTQPRNFHMPWVWKKKKKKQPTNKQTKNNPHILQFKESSREVRYVTVNLKENAYIENWTWFWIFPWQLIILVAYFWWHLQKYQYIL